MYKNILSIFSNKILVALFSVITTFVAARLLSPDYFGAIMVVLANVAILTRLLSLGVGQALQYYGALVKNKNESLVGEVFLSIILMVTFSTLVLVFGRQVIADWFLPESKNIKSLFEVLAVIIPFGLLNLLVSLYLLGSREIRHYRMLSTIPVFLCMAVVLTACIGGNAEKYVLSAYVLQTLAGGLLSVCFMVLNNIYKFDFVSKDFIKIFRLFKYGAKSYLISVVSFSSSRIGLVVAAWSIGEADLAILAISRTIGESVTMIYGAIGPLILSYTAGKDKKYSQNLLGVSCRLSSVVFLIVSVLIYALTAVFVPLFFSDHYSLVPALVAIILPGVVISTQQRMLENYLYGREKHIYLVYPHVFTACFLIAITYFLSKVFGVFGVVVAGLIGQFLLLVLTGFVAYKKDQLSPSIYLIPRISDFQNVLKAFRGRAF